MYNTDAKTGASETAKQSNGAVHVTDGTTLPSGVNKFVSALATPVNSAFSTALTGGTLAAATHFYRVSALNAFGETLASTETSQVTTGATSTVTVNWAAVPGATGYKVYGRTTGAQQLMATLGLVTTFIDTGAVTPSGALPAVNSTGLNTAKSLATLYGAALPVGSRIVLLQAETQNIRWTDDGVTVPTVSVGFVLKAGDPPFLYNGDLANLQFIEVAVSSRLNFALYF